MNQRGRPKHPDILTPREWEVLGMIREELSNEEIAQRLAISVDGVKYHVSEILGKLEVRNRREAATWRPEEKRPRWLAAGAPLLLWRRLGPSRLSPAVTGGLAVALAAGIGLLVWALLSTGGGGARTDAPPTVEGVPTTFLMLSGGFRPIDPATGRDLGGYERVTLASKVSISPDGKTAAFASPLFRGPLQLSLFDLERWEVASEVALSSDHGPGWMGRQFREADRFIDLHWSPDSTRLYVRTEENCSPRAIEDEVLLCESCEVLLCESWITTVDVAGGEVLSRAELPSGYPSTVYSVAAAKLTRLAPDGRTLFLFGNGNAIGQAPAPTAAAYVVALDLETGEVRGALELPEVLWGASSELDRPSEPAVEYLPAVAFSPDGRRAYIVHAEEERITIVDLQSMRIERSQQVGRRTSLFDGFLSVAGNRALAKEEEPVPETSASISAGGRPRLQERWASISPDGRYLYVGGWSDRIMEYGSGLGLQVIDTDSLEIVARIGTGGRPVEDTYRNTALHLSGRYLYAATSDQYPDGSLARKLLVLDPATLEVIARRTGGGAVLLAPAPGPAAAAP